MANWPPRATLRVSMNLWENWEMPAKIDFYRWLLAQVNQQVNLIAYSVAMWFFTQGKYDFPEGTMVLELTDNSEWKAAQVAQALMGIDQKQFPEGATHLWIVGQDGQYQVF